MNRSNDDRSSVNQPHDAFFKSLFRSFFADLLRLSLPEAAAALALDRLTSVRTDLADGPGKPRTGEVDLLARAPLRDPPDHRHALVHVEIEARFRRAMDARMVRYAHRLWGRYNAPLCQLVVFLSGGGVARGVRRIAGHARPFYRPAVDYVALCLERCDPADFLDRDEPLAWALSALMRAGNDDRALQKLTALQRIAAAGNHLTRQQRYLLAQTVGIYLPLSGNDAKRYAEMIHTQPEEIRNMMPRTYEDVLEEGRQMGHQLGVQEGHQLGVQEGRRALLRRQIEHRFGPMTETDRARLDAIDDLDALDRLAERLLDAPSVEALLSD
ncbi:MAG: DUF4351 domain-containing protein [Acidobacteriota bacterium]